MAAHPDDAELSCSGTILKHIAAGKKVGIVDFTRGELGTRGTPEIRLQESADATKILGLHARENLGIRDGFFRNDEETQLKLIEIIRKYQPDIVLANALVDRHPDHGKGAQLAIDACFLSGLRQIKTGDLSAWRPAQVYHYIQDRYIEPDFVVDISAHWDQKEAAIRAFKSQFFDPSSVEPASYISSPDFLNFIQARAMEMGHKIGVKYGEGFQSQKTLEVKSLI
ncbi:MAG: bacillithiol biosynthesis deacetylase BshB1 [Cytophagales bacterium]|nr:bacillithiol biosynthesis deacetylase BshB1 [Cytophagales bacterium]